MDSASAHFTAVLDSSGETDCPSFEEVAEAGEVGAAFPTRLRTQPGSLPWSNPTGIEERALLRASSLSSLPCDSGGPRRIRLVLSAFALGRP